MRQTFFDLTLAEPEQAIRRTIQGIGARDIRIDFMHAVLRCRIVGSSS
jgi:hypothetical protein